MSFLIEFRYRFEAAHRFTLSCAESCATPHGHTWTATLKIESPHAQLNSKDMVEEFATLKSQWKKFITEVVDHSYLHHWQDPLLESMRTHIPGLRGLPFPGDPTTELISALFLSKAKVLLQDAQSRSQIPFKIHSVEILETPTNQLSYTSSHPELWESGPYNQFQGWWLDSSIESREIQKNLEPAKLIHLATTLK